MHLRQAAAGSSYDLQRAATRRSPSWTIYSKRPPTLWRYREVLPPGDPVTLGEGMTPLVHAARLGASMGLLTPIRAEG